MKPTVVAVFGIDPFRVGGVELYVKEMARQLDQRGANLVAVFTKLPRGVTAEFLTAPNLTLDAIPALETSMRDSLKPLAEVLKRHQAQILHLMFVGFVGGGPWTGRLNGAKQVFFTAQGSDPTGYKSHRAPAWKRAAVRVINAPLTRVFCVSDYTRRSLAGLDLLPEDRFETVYNALPIPDLTTAADLNVQFRRRFSIPLDRELVTQVSWIIPEKGVPQLLEAARTVLRERPNTHFAMVGRGAQEAEYKQLAESYGIADAITWTGLIENPIAEGVYAATDIFCLASQWQEAFGFVLAEAMAFKKPAVGTAVGGIPEVIEDGVSGLLVDPMTDSDLLARQLLRLLNDPALRCKMGEAARRRVEEKFNLEKNVAQVIRHYAL